MHTIKKEHNLRILHQVEYRYHVVFKTDKDFDCKNSSITNMTHNYYKTSDYTTLILAESLKKTDIYSKYKLQVNF